jgi:pimeloyl-ACP methyl ester carboxylesterase
MSNEIGIVLIHGAGLGSWIWRETEKHLQTESLAIDFPGRNNDSKDNKSLTLDDYCDHVLDCIRDWDKQQVILVGHSIGGVIALKLADQLGHRVVGFVGISAAIPKNGGPFISTFPFLKRLLMNVILRIAGTKPPKSAIIKSLCNDLTSDQSELVADKFVPESTHLYFDKCNATIPITNKLYIKSSNDLEFPKTLQDEMIKNLDTRQIHTLESGHLPMISCPQQLADILDQFAAKCKT